MFKNTSLLPMFKQLTFIFSLLFTNYCCFSPNLLFPYGICLVSVIIHIFNCEEFIYGTFEDCIGLCSSHFCSSFQNLN